MDIILEAKMLCKTFSNGGLQQHVLKNLNISIYKNDFTIIMGSSGSGKSTLLYSLSGMDKPTLGILKFGNEEISKYNNDELAIFRRKHCGFVFQQIYLNDAMSVLDNILVCGYLACKNRKKVAENAKKLLNEVNIPKESFSKFPSQLSGGEAQRVGIVRALINKPEIIFADEPTGALNSTNAQSVLDIMTRMNNEGQSIVMVTHDIKTALRANRILYLKDGVIIDELSLSKFTSNDDEKRHKKLQDFLNEMGW